MNLEEFKKSGSYVGVLQDISFTCKEIYYLLGSNMPTDLYSRLKHISDNLDSIEKELLKIAENE